MTAIKYELTVMSILRSGRHHHEGVLIAEDEDDAQRVASLIRRQVGHLRIEVSIDAIAYREEREPLEVWEALK